MSRQMYKDVEPLSVDSHPQVPHFCYKLVSLISVVLLAEILKAMFRSHTICPWCKRSANMLIPVQNPETLPGFVGRFSVMDPFIQIDESDVVTTFYVTRVPAVQVIHRWFINCVVMNKICKKFNGTQIGDHCKARDVWRFPTGRIMITITVVILEVCNTFVKIVTQSVTISVTLVYRPIKVHFPIRADLKKGIAVWIGSSPPSENTCTCSMLGYFCFRMVRMCVTNVYTLTLVCCNSSDTNTKLSLTLSAIHARPVDFRLIL